MVRVPGGAVSLRSMEHGETFHPGIGPMEEACLLHVAQHGVGGRLAARGGEFVVWDVGLGAGANALAMLEAAREGGWQGVMVRSFDTTLEALRFAWTHAEELGYPARWKGEIGELLERGRVEAGGLRWEVEVGDFRQWLEREGVERPRVVMFDPYSPGRNPEMWTREVFEGIRLVADEECTLTSYSRSTVTRVKLLRAGWCVGRGAATGEKTETTIAATRLELLREPLGKDWLGRVRRSRALGGEGEAVARELAGHGQFAGPGSV